MIASDPAVALCKKPLASGGRTIGLEQGIGRMIQWYAGNFGGKVA